MHRPGRAEAPLSAATSIAKSPSKHCMHLVCLAGRSCVSAIVTGCKRQVPQPIPTTLSIQFRRKRGIDLRHHRGRPDPQTAWRRGRVAGTLRDRAHRSVRPPASRGPSEIAHAVDLHPLQQQPHLLASPHMERSPGGRCGARLLQGTAAQCSARGPWISVHRRPLRARRPHSVSALSPDVLPRRHPRPRCGGEVLGARPIEARPSARRLKR